MALQPAQEGVVSVYIPEDVCSDSMGVGNTPSNILSFVYDTTPPQVAITQVSMLDIDKNDGGTSRMNDMNEDVNEFIGRERHRYIRVVFTEEVQGFSIDALAIRHGYIKNCSGSKDMYSAVVVADSEEATVEVDVIANSTTDLAGNPNQPTPSPYYVRKHFVPPSAYHAVPNPPQLPNTEAEQPRNENVTEEDKPHVLQPAAKMLQSEDGKHSGPRNNELETKVLVLEGEAERLSTALDNNLKLYIAYLSSGTTCKFANQCIFVLHYRSGDINSRLVDRVKEMEAQLVSMQSIYLE